MLSLIYLYENIKIVKYTLFYTVEEEVSLRKKLGYKWLKAFLKIVILLIIDQGESYSYNYSSN